MSKNTINEAAPKINTSQDTLSLRAVWDNASKTASVESESNLYIFGGVEKMDAVAFSQKLKASVNLDESSQLYVQGWSYNPLANSSNDPFYDTGRALGIEAGYMKEFQSGLRFFVSAGATRGSSYGMVDAEQTDLEMGANDGTEYYATVGMGMSMGPRKPRNPRNPRNPRR